MQIDFLFISIQLLHKGDAIYRLLGEMWQLNFMRILKVSQNGLILLDEVGNKVIFLSDLLHIVQFELDGRIHNFEPHYHYDLEPEDSSYLYTTMS